MDRCERRNQSLIKRGKCDYVGPKAPSSSPLLCCRSHPPFVAASDRSSSLTYTDEINSTATERDALNKDQRQPKPQVAGGALCLCHPGGRQSVAAMTAATRRSSSMSSLYISSAYSSGSAPHQREESEVANMRRLCHFRIRLRGWDCTRGYDLFSFCVCTCVGLHLVRVHSQLEKKRIPIASW